MTGVPIFYDTETTGFIQKYGDPYGPHQPHICQIAAVVTEPHAPIVTGSINIMIKPDGWVIPKEASDVNGLTQDILEKYGLDLQVAMAMFSQLCKKAEISIAHHYKFDFAMIDLEFNRLGMKNPLPQTKPFCTMENSTQILQIPPTKNMLDKNMGHLYKSPNMQELHNHCFGREFKAAHNAMADVKAMIKCYFHLWGNDGIS